MSRIILPVATVAVVLAIAVLFAINTLQEATAPLEKMETALVEVGVEGVSTEEKVLFLAKERTAIDQALSAKAVPGRTAPEKVQAVLERLSEIETVLKEHAVSGGTVVKRVSVLAVERDQLQEQLSFAQTQVRTLESAIKASEKVKLQMAALTDAHNALAGELAAARSDLTSTRTQLDAARGELKSTRAQLDASQGDLKSTRTELDAARGELSVSRTQLASVAEAEQQAKSDLTAARSALEGARADTDMAEAEKSRFKEELTALKGEIVALGVSNAKMQKENRALSGELKQVRQRLAAVEARPAPAKTEMAAVAAQSERALPDFTFYFDFDESVLSEPAYGKLAKVVETAGKRSAEVILVSGYTDSLGPQEYNLWLSAERANAVIQGLQDELLMQDLADVKIRKEANGEARLPIATPDETREIRNRRVDIFLE